MKWNELFGIIPLIVKRLYCIFWRGHTFKQIAPEYQGNILIECTYCKKQKVI